MAVRKSLKTNGELDVARANNVLDLEFRELGVEAKLLDDTRVLARRQPRVIFGLRTSDDHLARREDERRGLGVTDTHDDGGETLEKERDGGKSDRCALEVRCTNLRVILCISCVQRDRLKAQTTIEVDGGDDVLQSRHYTLDGSNVLLLESEWRRSGGDGRWR